MSFLNESTKARIHFAKTMRGKSGFHVDAEFDEGEQLCFVYGLNDAGDVLAVVSFPVNPAAWTASLKQEIEKLFRGSALMATRGR